MRRREDRAAGSRVVMPVLRVLVILVSTTAVASACPAMVFANLPLTPDNATIAPDGGVVVNAVGGGGESAAELTINSQPIDVRQDIVAPGLMIWVPTSIQSPNTIDVRSARGRLLRSLTVGPAMPRHLPPKVSFATSTLTIRKRREAIPSPNNTSGTLVIELAEPPPSDVLAMVVFSKQGNDSVGVAWTTPKPDTKTYQFMFGGKRCGPGPGSIPQGARLQILWVDALGRLSMPSKQVRARPPHARERAR